MARKNLLQRRDARIAVAAGVCAAAATGTAFLLDGAGVLRLQSTVMAGYTRDLGFWLGTGPSGSIRFTHTGPYDHRLGYAALPDYIDRLAGADYAVAAQARVSPALARTMDWGLFAPYREKTQAGLAILDCRGDPLFAARYPERVYGHFDDVPRLVVDTLLFIENRDLLDDGHPHRNPAIDVERFFKAMIDQSVHAIYSGHDASGGSTLATQIEKYRHSPFGRTVGAKEKLRQMASASLRAYLGGENTQDARRKLVVDYLNTVPLSASEDYGEISGLGDGLWVWFGRDWDEVNRMLRAGSDAPLAERALAYKQALALIVAERRPSYYLRNIGRLQAHAETYLKLLAQNDVISAELRDAALPLPLTLRPAKAAPDASSYTARKAANAMRVSLAGMLGTPALYDLDRLDLTARSTLDARVQEQVAATLARLGEPAAAQAAGLVGPHLLQPKDAPDVLYSFILYERTPAANLLRVQADNLNQPWDVNDGAKLDLGSTAKLRTLLTYLGIVAELHERYAGRAPQDLKAAADPRDKLSQWALAYLASAEDRSLDRMLEAALDRSYSASPGEAFFTGGGVHHFENFDKDDNGRTLTVREGLRRSVNLVFVRLMRDVVRYYMFNMEGSSPAILSNLSDPQRLAYLHMHADTEGREYLWRFYLKYRGKTPDDALVALVAGMPKSPLRLAAALRYVNPTDGEARFGALLARFLPGERLPPERVAKLYAMYAPERYDLNDRGYLAHLHPLELWLLRYLNEHPDTDFAQASAASADERQQVYQWLFRPHLKRAQDSRILTMLEKKAFEPIHRDWKRLGYPFDTLVPSYASALGASADRPAALAELMGIVLNDGRRQPNMRIDTLDFAVDTPYETRLARRPAVGEQVLRPEIAHVARRLLAEVVTGGTAQRLNRVFKDGNGTPLTVGGKTGTGDHRLEIFAKGGRRIASRAVGRSGTFVFYLGDRHFGSLTAYVRGPAAAQFKFTSSLPLQVMKVLAPVLQPIVTGSDEQGCRPPADGRRGFTSVEAEPEAPAPADKKPPLQNAQVAALPVTAPSPHASSGAARRER